MSSSVNVIGVIMGGGVGNRLRPLTTSRSKPAVPVAGRYRLVDVPISNCINSGINQIYLLTQFNSASLHRHVQATYHFDQFSNGFVNVLAAEQTPESQNWYQGTADAVRQSFHHFERNCPDLVVILSGDQLYRMDFREVIEHHLRSGAEVTVSTKPVPRSEAGSLGIMQTDSSNRIVRFVEKPGDTPELDELRAPIYKDERYLASMGIYVFNADVLRALLESSDEVDFGKHFIPKAIDSYRVYSYIFKGYWKDIGTIRMFWEANLELTDPLPGFTFYDQSAPIYTRMRYLPPSKINQCEIKECLITEGSIISACRLERCVVGLRAIVNKGSKVKNTILMGADRYEHHIKPVPGVPPLGIGCNCIIEDAIIDKNARIGNGVRIAPKGREDMETPMFAIRDGVIVVKKGAIIPDGTDL